LERLIHLKHSHSVWSGYIKSLSAFISKALTVYSLNAKLPKGVKIKKNIEIELKDEHGQMLAML